MYITNLIKSNLWFKVSIFLKLQLLFNSKNRMSEMNFFISRDMALYTWGITVLDVIWLHKSQYVVILIENQVCLNTSLTFLFLFFLFLKNFAD